jgi:hypothetical protein
VGLFYFDIAGFETGKGVGKGLPQVEERGFTGGVSPVRAQRGSIFVMSTI